MQKKSSVIIIVFIFLFSFISCANAVSTEVYVQTEDTGIIIEYPKIFILKQNQDFHVRFHTFNKTTGKILTNESTNCVFNLYDFDGEGILRIANIGFGNTTHAHDCQNCFNEHIDGGNFSHVGRYSYLIRCETLNLGGAVSIGIEVTKTGTKLGISESLIYLILAFGVLLLFIISSYFMITIEYGNEINEKGAVIKLTKTKYIKLGFILLTWVLFTWFLNILIGLSDNFVSLTMFYGLFGFIFDVMNRLALPLGIIVIVIAFFEIIRDANIQKAISKFGSSK